MSNLQTRVISALILGAVVLGATIAGGWLFVLVSGVLTMVVWSEWSDIACPNSDDRVRFSGFILVCLTIFCAGIFPNNVLFVFWIGVVIAIAALSKHFTGNHWPTAGVIYSSGAFISLILLRNSIPPSVGLTAILYLFATVWATDIGAYFAGRKFGGPKIAVSISPNKTWSGAIGGIFAAVFAGILVMAISGRGDLFFGAILAIVLSVVAQAGDFFESWIKRRNGVKDSSQILPGHGGIMDRVDGLVFASVMLGLVCVLVAGFGNPAAALFL